MDDLLLFFIIFMLFTIITIHSENNIHPKIIHTQGWFAKNVPIGMSTANAIMSISINFNKPNSIHRIIPCYRSVVNG